MSPDLDKALCDKYPKIFVNRNGDMKDTAMVWGFDCGDGWHPLIDKLCSVLQWNTDKNNSSGKYPQVVAVQVKEKYGTLRFYVDGGGTSSDAMIEFAEFLSGSICDVCGHPGKLNGNGWLATRCGKHING